MAEASDEIASRSAGAELGDDALEEDLVVLLAEIGLAASPQSLHEQLAKRYPRVSCTTVDKMAERAKIERCSEIMGQQPIRYRSHANVCTVRHGLRDAEDAIEDARQWPERRRHILHNMQVVMGRLPPAAAGQSSGRPPLNFVVLSEDLLPACPGACGVRAQRCRFQPEAGDWLDGHLLLPVPREGAGAAPRPAVLCPHQTTADPRVGKDEPAGHGGSPELHYALELARSGFVTLAVDYPGFGTCDFPVYERGYESVTVKGLWNHLRAVDVLEGHPEVDPDRIGALGHSLGGHNALFLAAFDCRVKAVAASCGYTSFGRYAETMPQKDLTVWAWREKYMPRIRDFFAKDPAQVPFDFHEVLAACAPRPIFTNAPSGDANFDLEGVRHCVAEARKVYELMGARPDALEFVVPSAGHDFPAGARAACYRFFERNL